MEDKGKTGAQTCTFENAGGSLGFLDRPLWKRIRLGDRKCPPAKTMFPLVSADSHSHSCTRMYANYDALAGAHQEAAGGSSCL